MRKQANVSGIFERWKPRRFSRFWVWNAEQTWAEFFAGVSGIYVLPMFYDRFSILKRHCCGSANNKHPNGEKSASQPKNLHSDVASGIIPFCSGYYLRRRFDILPRWFPCRNGLSAVSGVRWMRSEVAWPILSHKSSFPFAKEISPLWSKWQSKFARNDNAKGEGQEEERIPSGVTKIFVNLMQNS